MENFDMAQYNAVVKQNKSLQSERNIYRQTLKDILRIAQKACPDCDYIMDIKDKTKGVL
ncbi:MAG: hypothetical protein SPL73_05615 [Cyanobacteriota bacterium]|nr:hypothetical protein [Cyanobacteriota bacterium]MDY6364349.1 hypothetical protein [Cyanobacteriota bacterium]